MSVDHISVIKMLKEFRKMHSELKSSKLKKNFGDIIDMFSSGNCPVWTILSKIVTDMKFSHDAVYNSSSTATFWTKIKNIVLDIYSVKGYKNG